MREVCDPAPWKESCLPPARRYAPPLPVRKRPYGTTNNEKRSSLGEEPFRSAQHAVPVQERADILQACTNLFIEYSFSPGRSTGCFYASCCLSFCCYSQANTRWGGRHVRAVHERAGGLKCFTGYVAARGGRGSPLVSAKKRSPEHSAGAQRAGDGKLEPFRRLMSITFSLTGAGASKIPLALRPETCDTIRRTKHAQEGGIS